MRHLNETLNLDFRQIKRNEMPLNAMNIKEMILSHILVHMI